MASSPNPKSWAEVRGTLALCALIVPFGYATLASVERLQLWRCPPGTFLAGAERLLLQNISLGVCAIALAMLVILTTAKSPTLFRFLGGERFFGDATTWRKTLRFFLFAGAATAAFGLWMANASYCLAPTRITLRPWPWHDVREFRWRDVDLVEARCTRSKEWSAMLTLRLRGGEEIEIPHTRIDEAYRGIRQSLTGLPFVLDTRDIDPNCGIPERDLLLHLR